MITDVARQSLAFSDRLLNSWLPGGTVCNGEYVVKNPKREDKRAGSFRINLQTGRWADFACAGAKGGDLVSLYAYLNDLSQYEAAQVVRTFI